MWAHADSAFDYPVFTTGDWSHMVSYPSACDPSQIPAMWSHLYQSSCTKAQCTYTPTHAGNIPYRGSPHVCALHSHPLKGPVSKGEASCLFGSSACKQSSHVALCTVGQTMQAATQGRTHPPILVQCEYRIQLLKEDWLPPILPSQFAVWEAL